MTSPTLEVTGAVVTQLNDDAPLSALLGTRIHDRVPVAPVFPYVSIGAASELEDDAECIDAVVVSLRLDVWSQAVGAPEALKIAAAVKTALHRQELELTDNALVEIAFRRSDKLRDPDGLTTHIAMEFLATVEQP